MALLYTDNVAAKTISFSTVADSRQWQESMHFPHKKILKVCKIVDNCKKLCNKAYF